MCACGQNSSSLHIVPADALTRARAARCTTSDLEHILCLLLNTLERRSRTQHAAVRMVYVGRSCATVPPITQVPWRRLSTATLSAAVPSTNDGAMACLGAKLMMARKPVRVVFFGSSVTAGIRCRNNKERSVNFPQQLIQLLEQSVHLNVSLDVYGYPGASPSFMRACHSTLMRTDAADLYILEMTDNLSDGYEGVGKSVEGLMSAVRQRAPHAALILLAPIPQRCVRSLKRMKPFQHVPLDDDSTRMLLQRDCYSNNSVAASFEDVGRAHDIPTVSARLLIRDQLWRNPAMAGHIISKLHYDAVHPSGAGHWQLAVALDYAIRAYLSGSANSESRVAHPISPKMKLCRLPNPGDLERNHIFLPRTVNALGSMVCALGDDLKRYVVGASGWHYTTEYNSQGLPKPGFIAHAPGSTLDLCHRPELRPDQLAAPGPIKVQVAWSLGYLMSYEHMGKMRGECVHSESSCTCGAREFNGHWRLPISQPHISRLKLQIRYARRTATSSFVPERSLHLSDESAVASCPCKIRLTLLNDTDSGEHKFKLVSLMSGFYTGTIVSDAVGWAARYDIM